MEIFGGTYQYTEAFCHYLRNSSEAKKIRNVKFVGGKNRRIWKITKNARKNMEIMGEKALR